MDFQSYFDAKLRKNGNSLIITVPSETLEKLKLEQEDILEVGINKGSDNKK